MSTIASIGSTTIRALSSTSSTAESSASKNAQSAAETAAGSTQISARGQLMAKLQELQRQDPEKFKAVMSDIASKLRAQATQSGDQGGALTHLADKFAQAAETGDLSPFQSSQAGDTTTTQSAAAIPHGHPHHQGGGGSGGVRSAVEGVFSSALAEVNQALGLDGSSTS